jgi:sulfur-carrier protein adenylyltransferase/sulfurtransferase
VFEAGPHLDAQAFKALDASRVQILDVREPWEFALAQIPGAQLIPLGELMDRMAELDAARPVAAYCHHGLRSLQALRILQGKGFTDLAHLTGGIDAYSQIDPAIPRYR